MAKGLYLILRAVILSLQKTRHVSEGNLEERLDKTSSRVIQVELPWLPQQNISPHMMFSRAGYERALLVAGGCVLISATSWGSLMVSSSMGNPVGW